MSPVGPTFDQIDSIKMALYYSSRTRETTVWSSC